MEKKLEKTPGSGDGECGAITVQDIDAWAASRSLDEVQRIRHRLWEAANLQPFVPVADRLDDLLRDVPELSTCLDVEAVRGRLAQAESLPDVVLLPGLSLIPLTAVAPELRAIHAACVSAVAAAPVSSVERAESWLRPLTADASRGDDLEAAIYFASRGTGPVPSSAELYHAWHDEIRHHLEWCKPKGYEQLAARAFPGESWHNEAAAALRLHGLRFYLGRRGEELTADATFLRAIQWLGVRGFDPWIKEATDQLSLGPDGDVDGPAAWAFFYYLRADLSLSLAQRHGLDTWFSRLARGSLDEDRPWYQVHPAGPPVWVDFIPIAAILVFASCRIQPTVSFEAVAGAINLVRETQLGNGGWPIYAHLKDANLLTTLACVHALSLEKPEGWQEAAARAATWIESQQDDLGYWPVRGEPTVTVTVLALDAINLARGVGTTTFTQRQAPGADSGDTEFDDPHYDLTGQLWHRPKMPKIARKARPEVTERVALLIVVATDVELKQVLAQLRPPYQKRAVASVHVDAETFFVGRFGVHSASVVRCSMGSTGPTAAQLAIAAGIRTWKPKAVIMPGIAFGMTRAKHRPADILVAEAVVPYESQRRGDGIVSRSPQYSANPLLVSRLRAPTWAFSRPDGTVVGRHVGLVLSGEKLVDNAAFKAELAEQHPNCIGGEMEGVGLAAAASRAQVPWALAKGVCDWGDGKKHDAYQEMAAASAVSLLKHVFADDEHALDGLQHYAGDA